MRFGDKIEQELKDRILGADLQHKLELYMRMSIPETKEHILTPSPFDKITLKEQELRAYLDSVLGRGNYKLLNMTPTLDEIVK